MYPYMLGDKISSYSVMLVIALIAAVALFRILSGVK